jgi:glycine/D-amino acid oxidase-like deaminating enzyme
MNGIPESFSFDKLPEDLEHIEPLLEAAIHRVPALGKAGIQLFFNGPESFTPDDRYLLGETPEVRNLFVAAGFNSIGTQSAGGRPSGSRQCRPRRPTILRAGPSERRAE